MKSFSALAAQLLVCAVLFGALHVKTEAAEPPAAPSAIRILSASPELGRFDVYLNEDPKPVFVGVKFGVLTPFKVVLPIKYIVTITKTGVKVPPLVTGKASVKAGENSTLVITRVPSKKPMPFPIYLILSFWAAKKPALIGAGVRFINLSPDAGLLDFVITAPTGENVTLDAGVKQMKVGDYSAAPNGTFQLDVLSNLTSEILATDPALELDPGSQYSVYVVGYAASKSWSKIKTVTVLDFPGVPDPADPAPADKYPALPEIPILTGAFDAE